MPLGLEDKRVPSGQLSASTYYNYHLSPKYGRLNGLYSWSVRSNRAGQWYQVDFVELMRVKGVATQGRQNTNQWVRSYTVSYSVDGMSYTPYRQGRGVKVNVLFGVPLLASIFANSEGEQESIKVGQSYSEVYVTSVFPLCIKCPVFEWNLEDFSENLSQKDALTEKKNPTTWETIVIVEILML